MPDAMRDERLTRQEIECAMRSEGIHNFDDVEAVVFESDAKLTIIPKLSASNNTELDDTVSETIAPLM